MTAALDRHPRWVVKAANWLIFLAEKHDLYFWKTYGELFLVWAKRFSHADVGQSTLFSSLRAMGLDWQYSPLLSEIDIGISQQTARLDHENWCAPELMRLSAAQLPPQQQRPLLELALNKADSNRHMVGPCVLLIHWQRCWWKPENNWRLTS